MIVDDRAFITLGQGWYQMNNHFYGCFGEQDMSVQYYKPLKSTYNSSLPVKLNKYRSQMTFVKWKWLAENLCGRNINDDMMFPAAVPWCELTGKCYEAPR
ncbi:MAG: hypothetical protein MN733_21035 [Nitrososphaera sp.]|nr:hypothetical protein [Nitrososphaera sp.]